MYDGLLAKKVQGFLGQETILAQEILPLCCFAGGGVFLTASFHMIFNIHKESGPFLQHSVICITSIHKSYLLFLALGDTEPVCQCSAAQSKETTKKSVFQSVETGTAFQIRRTPCPASLHLKAKLGGRSKCFAF